MKHFIVLFILLLAYGCSPKKTADIEKVDSEGVSGEGAAVKPVMLDVSGIELEAPQYDKDKAARPMPLSYMAMKGLQPEEFEAAVLRSFSGFFQPDNADVLKVREAADQGDESACEKIALFYLKYPPMDPRYDLGVEYLKKVNDPQTPEALWDRALIEYHGHLPNAAASRPYFEKVLALKDESSFRWLLNHDKVGLEEVAWNSLREIYEARATDGKDAEALYLLGELYNLYPKYRDIEKSVEWIKKAAELGYAPAIYVLGLMDLQRQDAQNALEKLKKSSDFGNEDASAMLSTLYLVALLKDSSDEALAFSNGAVFPALYEILRKDVSNSETGETTMGGIARVLEYGRESHGKVDGCKVIFALAAGGDWAKDIKEEAIHCMEEFVEKSVSRADCDALDNMLPFGSDDSYRSAFDENQRKRISGLMVKCYERMFVLGNNYEGSGLHVFSTATKLGMLYSGDIDENIEGNPMLYAQYLVYSAIKNEDIVAQMALAQAYVSGDFFDIRSQERACYWSTKTTEQDICQKYCKTVRVGDEESLVLDEEMGVDDAEMAMMICSVCQVARESVSQYCGSGI